MVNVKFAHYRRHLNKKNPQSSTAAYHAVVKAGAGRKKKNPNKPLHVRFRFKINSVKICQIVPTAAFKMTVHVLEY